MARIPQWMARCYWVLGATISNHSHSSSWLQGLGLNNQLGQERRSMGTDSAPSLVLLCLSSSDEVGGGPSYWGGLSSIGRAPTIAGPGDCGHSLQRGAPLCLEKRFRRSVTQAAARFSCRPLNTFPGPLSPPTLLLFHLFTNLSESKSIATDLLFSTAHNLKHRSSLLDHPLCQSPWAANSGPSKRRRSFGWS